MEFLQESPQNAIMKFRKWTKEESARELHRDYLSEQGLKNPNKSKFQELLDERQRIALESEDENIRLKAIDSAITFAAGNEKVTNVQNNQYNFSEFLNSIKQ